MQDSYTDTIQFILQVQSFQVLKMAIQFYFFLQQLHRLGYQVRRNGLGLIRLAGEDGYPAGLKSLRWPRSASPSRRSARLAISRTVTPACAKCACQVFTTSITVTTSAAASVGTRPNASHCDIAFSSVESRPWAPQMNSWYPCPEFVGRTSYAGASFRRPLANGFTTSRE